MIKLFISCNRKRIQKCIRIFTEPFLHYNLMRYEILIIPKPTSQRCRTMRAESVLSNSLPASSSNTMPSKRASTTGLKSLREGEGGRRAELLSHHTIRVTFLFMSLASLVATFSFPRLGTSHEAGPPRLAYAIVAISEFWKPTLKVQFPRILDYKNQASQFFFNLVIVKKIVVQGTTFFILNCFF